jgi:transposase
MVSRETIRYPDGCGNMVTLIGKNQTPSHMEKSPEQRILELEQQVKLLEKQKAFLEKQVETADKKAIIFDMMIDLAEKEFNIAIRKKCSPEQLTITGKDKKKL